MLNAKIYTRSMNGRLYRMAMGLCGLPYGRVRLVGTTAEGYLRAAMDGGGADWVVNIDEDAFVCDEGALERLVDYCVAEGYDNCGMPDGGVAPLRDGNPLVTNPFFNVFRCAATRGLTVDEGPLAGGLRTGVVPAELLTGAYDFGCMDAEPYYPLLLAASQRCRTLYLGARAHPDGESTVLLNHRGEPFLIHTWYSRLYGRDRGHTRRIDRAWAEACRAQGIGPRRPLGGRLATWGGVVRSEAVGRAVALKHKLLGKA